MISLPERTNILLVWHSHPTKHQDEARARTLPRGAFRARDVAEMRPRLDLPLIPHLCAHVSTQLRPRVGRLQSATPGQGGERQRARMHATASAQLHHSSLSRVPLLCSYSHPPAALLRSKGQIRLAFTAQDLLGLSYRNALARSSLCTKRLGCAFRFQHFALMVFSSSMDEVRWTKARTFRRRCRACVVTHRFFRRPSSARSCRARESQSSTARTEHAR
eukprot:6188750-Pleurochrysis_carterae.AAC.1